MRQKLALLLAGLLVGGLLMTVVPVGAHHQPAQRKLAKKVNRLQNRLNALTTKVNNRTQLLTADGDYIGFIIGEQVLSLCPAGSTATWEQLPPELGAPEEITWIDTCFPDESSSARHQLSQRELQRVLRR